MCLFNKPNVKPPPLPPPAPLPVPAPRPAPPLASPPAPAPEPLQTEAARPGIQLKRRRREAQGAVSRGSGALRIPINTGTGGKAGGINLG